VAGCVQNTFQVQDPARADKLAAPLASEIVLEVDDAGVTWGAGKVGDVLKDGLVKNGTFGQVHYPIYPRHAVSIKLHVVARGEVETDAAAGMTKSFVTGFLFFLPAGVLQYRDTFKVTADVSVVRDGRKLGPLFLESKAHADHTLFSGPESYAAQGGKLALEDLAGRLAATLSENRAWFAH
jgi:hypothetical protein